MLILALLSLSCVDSPRNPGEPAVSSRSGLWLEIEAYAGAPVGTRCLIYRDPVFTSTGVICGTDLFPEPIHIPAHGSL